MEESEEEIKWDEEWHRCHDEVFTTITRAGIYNAVCVLSASFAVAAILAVTMLNPKAWILWTLVALGGVSGAFWFRRIAKWNTSETKRLQAAGRDAMRKRSAARAERTRRDSEAHTERMQKRMNAIFTKDKTR